MKRNLKRGMTMEGALVTIAIFGIVLILLAIMYKTFYAVGQQEFTEKECQTSLLLTRAADVSPICKVEASTPVPIKCNRNFATVTEDSVSVNGKEMTSKYDATCPSGYADQSCLAERVVAEEMRKCWALFFEGEQPVFQQMEKNELSITPDTNIRVCYVCAEVNLQSDVKDLRGYLKAQSIKGDRTYYDFFTNRKAHCDPKLRQPSCWEGIAEHPELQHANWLPDKKWPKLELGTLPKDQTYAVVFMRRGMGTCEDSKIKEGEPAALTNTVQVIPAEKIAQYCSGVMI